VLDRGSYPTDAFVDPTDRLELPSGEIDLVLRLRPAEDPSPRDQVAGLAYTINPQQVLESATPGADIAGTLVTDSYAWVVSESPTTANPPTPIPVPSPNYRSNLSYA